MPPESVRLHRHIVCACTGVELPLKIERPAALPVFSRHVDGGERSLHLLEPCSICRSFRHGSLVPYSKLPSRPATSAALRYST